MGSLYLASHPDPSQMAEGILKLGCPYVFNMDMKLPVNGVLPVIAPWGTLTAVPLTVKPGDIEGYRRI